MCITVWRCDLTVFSGKTEQVARAGQGARTCGNRSVQKIRRGWANFSNAADVPRAGALGAHVGGGVAPKTPLLWVPETVIRRGAAA